MNASTTYEARVLEIRDRILWYEYLILCSSDRREAAPYKRIVRDLKKELTELKKEYKGR